MKIPRREVLVVLFLTLCAVFGCRRESQPPREAVAPARAPESAACPVPAVVADPVSTWRPVVGQTVILDPGHGGKDMGASHFGLAEKDVNLDVALRAAALLQALGVRVLLTRDRDVFIPLAERSVLANRNPGAAFVSIHINAAPSNPNAVGVETFILSSRFSDADRGLEASGKFKMNGDRSPPGRKGLASFATEQRGRGPALAESLQRSLTSRLGEVDRGVKPGNLAVLRETYFCAAALVELGFATNARTAERMRTEEWRRRAAEGLAEGIADFLRRP